MCSGFHKCFQKPKLQVQVRSTGYIFLIWDTLNYGVSPCRYILYKGASRRTIRSRVFPAAWQNKREVKSRRYLNWLQKALYSHGNHVTAGFRWFFVILKPKQEDKSALMKNAKKERAKHPFNTVLLCGHNTQSRYPCCSFKSCRTFFSKPLTKTYPSRPFSCW